MEKVKLNLAKNAIVNLKGWESEEDMGGGAGVFIPRPVYQSHAMNPNWRIFILGLIWVEVDVYNLIGGITMIWHDLIMNWRLLCFFPPFFGRQILRGFLWRLSSQTWWSWIWTTTSWLCCMPCHIRCLFSLHAFFGTRNLFLVGLDWTWLDHGFHPLWKIRSSCYLVLCWGFLTTPLVDYALRIELCVDVFFFWMYFMKMRCVLIFFAWLETLRVHFFCGVGIADSDYPISVCHIHNSHCKDYVCASRWSKCGQTSNGTDKTHDTVGKRVGGSGRHQFASIQPTCCWSCWQSLGGDPHYRIAGTLSPPVVAVFCRSELARQGVGGCRELPWWTFGLFSAHCTGGLAIEVHCDQTSSGWGPHCGRKKKSHHFVGQWSVLRQFRWWWSICQQVCGVHGDSDAAEKLGRPDVVRLAQFLWSSRLCGIFGAQLMGPWRSEWNGWDPLRLWF